MRRSVFWLPRSLVPDHRRERVAHGDEAARIHRPVDAASRDRRCRCPRPLHPGLRRQGSGVDPRPGRAPGRRLFDRRESGDGAEGGPVGRLPGRPSPRTDDARGPDAGLGVCRSRGPASPRCAAHSGGDAGAPGRDPLAPRLSAGRRRRHRGLARARPAATGLRAGTVGGARRALAAGLTAAADAPFVSDGGRAQLIVVEARGGPFVSDSARAFAGRRRRRGDEATGTASRSRSPAVTPSRSRRSRC